jgi:hypothetical protein
MKTMFTLLLATIFSSAAFAANDGRLSITTSGSNFVVYVDGRVYQDNNNSTVVLSNVQAGNHSIKVYRQVKSNNGRNNRNDRRNELLYSSNVYVRPSYHVDVMINRFGKALVDERALSGSYNDDDWNGNGNYGNGGYGSNGNNGNYGNGGYGNDNGYRQPMASAEFEQLVTSIRSQWFSNGKMTTAKDAMGRSYFSTSQVRRVLELISAENDRLELAKLVYRNTTDQKNFYNLFDLFTFQSNKDDLDRYIKNFRY